MKNGRRRLYPDWAMIKILVKGNPTREGTDSRVYFEMAKAAKTFGDYRAAGGNLKYLYYFQGTGKLAIVV